MCLRKWVERHLWFEGWILDEMGDRALVSLTRSEEQGQAEILSRTRRRITPIPYT